MQSMDEYHPSCLASTRLMRLMLLNKSLSFATRIDLEKLQSKPWLKDLHEHDLAER